MLLGESETEVTLNSGFDSDDSPEHINSIYSDLGGEEMEGYESTVVADVTRSDKRVTKCIRVRKYTGQGIVVYWRFAVLFDKATGKMIVCVNPKWYRPTDVVNLWGDPTKAKTKLGWNPQKTSYEELCSIMAQHDL